LSLSRLLRHFSLALEADIGDPCMVSIGKSWGVNHHAYLPEDCYAVARPIAANGIGQKTFWRTTLKTVSRITVKIRCEARIST